MSTDTSCRSRSAGWPPRDRAGPWAQRGRAVALPGRPHEIVAVGRHHQRLADLRIVERRLVDVEEDEGGAGRKPDATSFSRWSLRTMLWLDDGKNWPTTWSTSPACRACRREAGWGRILMPPRRGRARGVPIVRIADELDEVAALPFDQLEGTRSTGVAVLAGFAAISVPLKICAGRMAPPPWQDSESSIGPNGCFRVMTILSGSGASTDWICRWPARTSSCTWGWLRRASSARPRR